MWRVLLVLMGGCSLFMPQVQHHRVQADECDSSYALPIADAMLVGAATAFAVYVNTQATADCNQNSISCDVTAMVAISPVVFAGIAVYGAMQVGRCRAVKSAASAVEAEQKRQADPKLARRDQARAISKDALAAAGRDDCVLVDRLLDYVAALDLQVKVTVLEPDVAIRRCVVGITSCTVDRANQFALVGRAPTHEGRTQLLGALPSCGDRGTARERRWALVLEAARDAETALCEAVSRGLALVDEPTRRIAFRDVRIARCMGMPASP